MYPVPFEVQSTLTTKKYVSAHLYSKMCLYSFGCSQNYTHYTNKHAFKNQIYLVLVIGQDTVTNSQNWMKVLMIMMIRKKENCEVVNGSIIILLCLSEPVISIY